MWLGPFYIVLWTTLHKFSEVQATPPSGGGPTIGLCGHYCVLPYLFTVGVLRLLMEVDMESQTGNDI